jgi:hypothetical protein
MFTFYRMSWLDESIRFVGLCFFPSEEDAVAYAHDFYNAQHQDAFLYTPFKISAYPLHEEKGLIIDVMETPEENVFPSAVPFPWFIDSVRNDPYRKSWQEGHSLKKVKRLRICRDGMILLPYPEIENVVRPVFWANGKALDSKPEAVAGSRAQAPRP